MRLTILALIGLSLCTLRISLADEPTVKVKKVRPADSDSPFAEGWPDATLPDQVEVKNYPAYRSAVAKAKKAPQMADNVMFLPLFNHISKNNIAMTSPVVNTYTPEMIETPGSAGDMTMEFLYRTPTMGQLGQSGPVEVKDFPATTYVCLGLEGGMNDTKLRDGAKTLKAWLADHKDEWVEAGPLRRLGYHGPMTPVTERRWEVQIPVKSAKAKAEK